MFVNLVSELRGHEIALRWLKIIMHQYIDLKFNSIKNTTMISAKVIADSKNEFGNRITTMVVTFPRIILAEFNTHRMFSRNSASSRAIPFEKMVKSVEENPFVPIAWQKDHKGMQGTEYFSNEDLIQESLDRHTPAIEYFERTWLEARDAAVNKACHMHNQKLTKQFVNRVLEPYMWHTVIVTATEWENFFALRCPKYSLFYEQIPMEFRSKKDLLKFVDKVESPEFKKDYENLSELDWLQCNKGQAEIHMMALAEAMWDAYNESTPKELKAGEWHIPFGDKISVQLILEQFDKENKGMSDKILNELEIKIATARCARVSYTVVGEEGKPDNYEADIKLHDRLATSGHWSPFEHCAQAMSKKIEESSFNADDGEDGTWGWSGNFRGFIQYRKMFANENIK